MRKRMLGTAISSLALAVTFGFAGALPALATPHIFEEGVCPERDSGKIDTTGNPLSVTVTAPEGMVITGYCVKAGSIEQGDGPEPFEGLSETSVTIVHPSGKAVSHYSVSYGLAPIVWPPVTFIVDDFPLPTFIDKCGTLNDEVIPQEETDQARFYYDEDLRAVVAVAKEEDGYIIQQDIQFVWPNTNTDVPCEVIAPPVEEKPPVVTPPNEDVTEPIGNEPPAQVIAPPAKEVVKTPVAAVVPASVESTEKVEEAELVVQATSTDVLAETGANPSLLPWGIGLLFVGIMAVLSMSNKFRRLVIKK